MRSILSLVFVLFFMIESIAQSGTRCGQFPLESQWWKVKGQTDMDVWRKQRLQLDLSARTTSDTDTIFIPVVVHVMHVPGHSLNQQSNISDAQIRSQITVLNEDFNRIQGTRGFNNHPSGAVGKVVFFLARLDPQGNPTNGINRVPYASSTFFNYLSQDIELKALSMWPPKRYLNIWIVNSMISDVIGYAYLPETLAGDSTFREQADGLVVVANCFGSIEKRLPFDPPFNINAVLRYGRTATHEVGHYLNLYHTWGDAFDCSGTDFVDDTPPCTGPQFGCPSSPLIQCSNQPRMIENYLDYTDDGCMNVFTVNQIGRMRSAIRTYPFRSEMVSLQNLTNTGFFINNQIPKDLVLAASDTQQLQLGKNADSLIVRIRNTQFDGISNWPVRFTLKEKPSGSKTKLDTIILTQSGGFARYTSFKPDVPGLYEISASSQVPEGSPKSIFINAFGLSSVFPNPFSDRIFLKTAAINEIQLLRLMEVNGKELERVKPVLSSGYIEMETGKIPAGVYFLEVIGSAGTEIHKIVKQ